ncbi:putative reverse transcriptase domain-containing protein, partial [Tanacetum coccineum]
MRSTPATTTNPAITTSVTNSQLKAMIDQGVTDALAARDADRNTNGDHSHNLGTGVRRTERVARECTYPDIIKCQPLNSSCALTWWKSHVRTVGHDVAYAMTWAELKKKMTDKYCLRGEMKKLEVELWNLKVKGSGEKKPYGGSKPLCPKCNYHHDGPCAPKCHKCNRVGHLARNYRSPANANTGNNQRGTRA